MRHSNTGKSEPQPAPVKRGFFAAAGERLKRAMSGTRAETADTASLPASTAEATAEAPDGVEGEVTTSVQAKARELLLQDRAHKRGRPNVVVESDDVANQETRPRKTSPPPLPWQRTAADATDTISSASSDAPAVEASAAPSEATTGTQPVARRASRPAAKRPARDSKSEALRARLGAAKAALAQAQAKRAAETGAETVSDAEPPHSDATEPEIILEFLDETPSRLGACAGETDPQLTADSSDASPPSAADASHGEVADAGLKAAGAEQRQASDPQLAAASTTPPDLQPRAAEAAQSEDRPSKPPSATTEPIRTLTIARVLARQGYYDRALSIYDALLKEAPDDANLRAEADRVRADKAGEHA